jgi:hypothetical protein
VAIRSLLPEYYLSINNNWKCKSTEMNAKLHLDSLIAFDLSINSACLLVDDVACSRVWFCISLYWAFSVYMNWKRKFSSCANRLLSSVLSKAWKLDAFFVWNVSYVCMLLCCLSGIAFRWEKVTANLMQQKRIRQQSIFCRKLYIHVTRNHRHINVGQIESRKLTNRESGSYVILKVKTWRW